MRNDAKPPVGQENTPLENAGPGVSLETRTTLYVWWADNGAIRKWSREPFGWGEAVNAETVGVSDIAPDFWLYTRGFGPVLRLHRDLHLVDEGFTETPLYRKAGQ